MNRARLGLGRGQDLSRLVVQLELVSNRFQRGHVRLGTFPLRGLLHRGIVVCCWSHNLLFNLDIKEKNAELK